TLGELVVVVQEREMRPAGALDHALARRVAEVLVERAADEQLVSWLELRGNAVERGAERAAPSRRDDHRDRHPLARLAHARIMGAAFRPMLRRAMPRRELFEIEYSPDWGYGRRFFLDVEHRYTKMH